ncbi:SgcJ/EcaC family oxidoreductase [Acidovorax sp. A1169]|uniref:YybH family protein n=1 Tax=Acidovorax sp. A1169 TaxID=3059524 RepID=UPI002737D470|nr:SgcJ/EcaC family oxidoreductase [Acidovorax sp. A1169]MDP4078539.1 SgcJ/EcaC family oxidoreductase [Acidovorax sp. A1169]
MTNYTSRRGAAVVAVASIAAFLSLPSVVAHAGPASDTSAIRQTLQRYEEALNRADTAAIVQLYTDDGVQMAPDAPAAVGREALRGAYAGTFQAIALKLAFTVDEIQLLGKDAALLRSHSAGTLKVQGNDKPAGAAAFKELFVLRKQGDGQWKFTHYSFSAAPARP